jgi:hypothetical protein
LSGLWAGPWLPLSDPSVGMTTIDFARSFLTFRIDSLKKPPQTVSHPPPYSLNSARIQLDCVCDIRDLQTGNLLRFVLGANCKTERVGVPSDVWTVPNADFIPVVSQRQFLNIKTYTHLGQEQGVLLYGHGRQQPDRQSGLCAEAFDALRIHVGEAPGEPLLTAAAICDATYGHYPLVASTAWETTRYAVELTYPVKTVNVNERDFIYQTDTGPILWPDLNRAPEELLEGFELAFSAFNGPEWIECLLRVPTEIPGGLQVYHYSRPVRREGVRNSLWRLL